MVRRQDLAMVKKEIWRVLAYARDLCEIRCLCEIGEISFLAAPPCPYMGGEVSRSDPSRLQVFANPNESWASWASSVILYLGCSR
jgi:hypothetical protein